MKNARREAVPATHPSYNSPYIVLTVNKTG
jgi:hypothetical protein